jgi:cytochrome c oxidase subunit 2
MKMDVVPGRNNKFAVTPNTEGVFMGKCAELCGEYHSMMLFNVKVVSRAEFDTQMAALAAKGNTGLLDETYNRNQNLPGNGSEGKG